MSIADEARTEVEIEMLARAIAAEKSPTSSLARAVTPHEVARALVKLGYRKPEAAPSVKPFDTSREPVKNGSDSLQVEAAPSDTDREKAASDYSHQERFMKFRTPMERMSYEHHFKAGWDARTSQPVQAPSDTDTDFKRIPAEVRAELIHMAEGRIKDVWADSPEGVDAATLAGNVVSAQEFVWMQLAAGVDLRTSQPVQVEVTETEWEYGHLNGDYITIPPAGIPHTHRRIKAVPAGEWEVAPAALGGGDHAE